MRFRKVDKKNFCSCLVSLFLYSLHAIIFRFHYGVVVSTVYAKMVLLPLLHIIRLHFHDKRLFKCICRRFHIFTATTLNEKAREYSPESTGVALLW